jgi:hypothetical protein
MHPFGCLPVRRETASSTPTTFLRLTPVFWRATAEGGPKGSLRKAGSGSRGIPRHPEGFEEDDEEDSEDDSEDDKDK